MKLELYTQVKREKDHTLRQVSEQISCVSHVGNHEIQSQSKGEDKSQYQMRMLDVTNTQVDQKTENFESASGSYSEKKDQMKMRFDRG